MLALLLLLGCSESVDPVVHAETSSAEVTAPEISTPVRVVTVVRGTIELSVTATGRTEALRAVRIRAPFAGRLVALEVADGDAVASGAEVGALVAQNSDAALEGARGMVAAARTEQERSDAHRALELAESGLVRQPLRAPAAGVVLSHAANAGDFVAEGDEIATVADVSSIAFVAQIGQSDLRAIQPGQPAQVKLTAEGEAIPGVVHGVLPAASAENLNARVRIDLVPPRGGRNVGLFGTVRIVVAQHRDVLVLPEAAVLRDDISGESRAALVSDDGSIRWVPVTINAREGDTVEVQAAELQPGARVIVAGHVGLPEGARVRVES